MTQNPTQFGKVVTMEAPISDFEDERTTEALSLIRCIHQEDYSKLTTWEMQMIADLQEGKAATKVRIVELRRVVKRLSQNV